MSGRASIFPVLRTPWSIPERRKKLIEVALPLEEINRASVPEKAPRPGHPATLHFWRARRLLAACHAVLFWQLVDDPASQPERFPTEEAQEVEPGRHRVASHATPAG